MVLSEFKLRVPSDLLALIADRLLADRSVDAHRRNEQSWSPDASPIPVPLLQEMRKAPLTLGARDTLHGMHHTGHRLFGGHPMQMDMIGFNAQLFNKPVQVKFPHFLQHDPGRMGHPVRQDLSSIPGDPPNVAWHLRAHMRGLLMRHQLPVYRRTPDLALIPALPDRELSLI